MGLTSEALQRIRDAVGDDDLVIAEILQSFVDEVDDLLDTLAGAAATNDVTVLRRVAHTLKSNCRDLGDEAAGDLCAKLESDARGGEINKVDAATAQIVDKVLALKSEVVSYLNPARKGSRTP
ncbi:Hpt domain-containing protein [Tabrizicola sp. BL-A-41-H6]|uniref:Hpt domain-containing protein n=1 Tax=Tabrizicola sp. BL-A-41-H6 TaxID=3421107 RepID=UPI003D67EFC4